MGGTDRIIPDRPGNGEGGRGGREDSEEDKKVVVLKNIRYRTFASRGSNGLIEHFLVLKGLAGTKCSLELKAGTDDSFDTVNLTKVEDMNGNLYRAEGNLIYDVDLKEKGEIKLKALIDGKEKYSLNITAYED